MSIGSRQHTEFLLDFNCELNKKSRDDWKLLSSDHRHYARRSSHVTVDVITSICNAFGSKGFLLSLCVRKLRECSNELSYNHEVECGSHSLFFYK